MLKTKMEQIGRKFILLFGGQVGNLPHQFSHVHNGTMALCDWICNPADAHVYFFGADAFSFGDGVRLEDGDVMEIELAGFGRALRNPVRIQRAKQKLVKVTPVCATGTPPRSRRPLPASR